MDGPKESLSAIEEILLNRKEWIPILTAILRG